MHKHFYRLERRWRHPNGYLFRCNRCTIEGLYDRKFVRLTAFWK